MVSGFCHKTKGGSTQRNGRAIPSEQIKIQINPGSGPAAQLVGGKHGALGWNLGVGSPKCRLGRPRRGCWGSITLYIHPLPHFFASLSTSHCQLVHLWCDPLHTLFCTSGFISILPLVLCSPMKTDYHSL